MRPLLAALFATVAFWLLAAAPAAEPKPAAPLKVHILTGPAGSYKAVESLAEFREFIEKNYRVQCTTSIGKKANEPLPELAALKDADVLIVFVRRMNLPEEPMAAIRSHWEMGKPVVALRTASHAFQAADNEVFDRKVLGGNYSGYGNQNPFKAVPAASQAEHPVLKGVGPITSHTYYNNGSLAAEALVLQVVDSSKEKKSPVSWVHSYKGARTFYSSLGVREDFQDENFRRLLINAIFWTTKRDQAEYRRPAGQ